MLYAQRLLRGHSSALLIFSSFGRRLFGTAKMPFSANALVSKQREFFNTGATKPVGFRREQLSKLRRVLVENEEKLCRGVFEDLRRPAHLTKPMELDRLIAEIDYALENLEEWMSPEKKKEETYGTPFIYKDPLGVVLVISPFNFPLILSLRPLLSAMAAGNCVILKPSEVSPNTSKAMAEVLNTNFDENYLTAVEGEVDKTIALLDEKFDHIFYTGSPGIARSIMKQAAAHLTPVTLELGGKCPAVVEEDANLEKAATSIVHGKFANVGQLCMATDYVLVNEKVKERFVETLKKVISEKFGPKASESEIFSRIINERHFRRLQDLIDRSSGKLLYKSNDENKLDDLYIGPHVFEVKDGDSLLEGEIFGPLLPIRSTQSFDEAIGFINKHHKPLNAYIFSADEQKINRFLNETHSGSAVSNGTVLNYYSLQLPFGGVGESGMGRYHGKYGFDTFTHEKAVLRANL